MKLIDFLKNEKLIFINNNFLNKNEVLHFISKKLVEVKYANDDKKIYNLFEEREKTSTAIGDEFAIPHILTNQLTTSTIIFLKTNAIDWQAFDEQNVKYIFAIALKQNDSSKHIEILQKLSKILMNPNFKKEIKEIKNTNEFLDIINKYENLIDLEISEKTNDEIYDIVAVTACPTGIAHTFLAKENLVKAAQKLNIKIKVETQGTEGIENSLSDSDIKNAKGVIIAADRTIDKQKFAKHNNVLEISTKNAIHNAQLWIEKALELKGSTISAKSDDNAKKLLNKNENFSFKSKDFGRKIYQAIMNGVSHMLPFVVFGGIMIALSFILDTLIGLSSGQSLDDPDFLKNYGSFYSVSKWFITIGGSALGFAIPILTIFIAYAIRGRITILPALVIGLIASGKMSSSYSFLGSTLGDNSEKILETGSGFIGAIIGAFFIIVMLDLMNKYIFNKMPKSLMGIKNILIIPLLGTLVIALMFWVVNILFIYINYGLNLFLGLMTGNVWLIWLLGIIIGAMMAIDLGGPINKAAYVFAVFSISSSGKAEHSAAMAIAMAAGMVPPLGISLSMFLHKKIWSNEEIKAGKWSNIIFGLSFISEGAIPYTSAKPKILIPANIVGGIVAGLIAAILGTTIIAPHGGIFVIFLLKSTLFNSFGLQVAFGIIFWLVAILAGAIAQALTIYILSKYHSRKLLARKR
ncbi:PTS fructose transporter subunit IIABC [Mesomycoplasma neurolyticum]|uniref:PTS system protein n=1 Tax=Mesomycoplasma neurolyticum TaxID=2120 RepID=A0A449A4S5_9BACT|nr:fructose-specific PTS transporter subunit EIIC [Mesomycoplasma neurolyticum]VEU59214.1 PTS system protein [Mesomycoplasma neurolyticum]